MGDSDDKRKIKFPFEINELKENGKKMKEKLYKSEMIEKMYFVGPKNYCFFDKFKNYADDLYNVEIRSDDVWLFGFPRSGTTLCQEIIWLIGNDLDYKKASETVMDIRFTFFDNVLWLSEDNKMKYQFAIENLAKDKAEIAHQLSIPAFKRMAEDKGRRFIKTHIPISLMTPKILTAGCKIFYVCRDPRDVIVSNYHIYITFKSLGETIDFPTYWRYFRDDFIIYTPYLEHLKEGWAFRHHENVFFLIYDEYMRKKHATLIEISKFLNKNLTNNEIVQLEQHLNIENFRKNKSLNNDHLREFKMIQNKDDAFIRVGKVGGWKDYFKGDLMKEVDEWLMENLKDCQELLNIFK